MKYLKICSFAVALLLLAPSAQAAVECKLATSLQELRMESGAEKVDNLEVTCTWDTGDFVRASIPADGSTASPAVADSAAGATAGTKFNLELDFNGMVAEDPEDEDQMPTLWLADLDANTIPTAAANAALTDATKISTVDKDGNRSPAPAGETSGSSVLWTDLPFPHTWDGGAANATGASFKIGDLYIDASSVNNDRLKATIVLTATNIDTEDESDVARIKQAVDLELGNEQKAQKFNSCEPGGKVINVNIVEGFRKAWRAGNDILLTTSSGKISVDKDDTPVGALDVTAEGGADELIIDVSGASNAKDDSDELKIKFSPAMGGEGNVTISAMLLPMRRTNESFAMSAELIVGSFDVCKGDPLFFPFVTSMSGWDTGIVVVNDSKVDGSCYLNWGNMEFDDADDMAAYVETLPTIDVDAKDHMAFLVSAARGADYSGSVLVQCTFSSATGYVFLSDSANGIGQGYLVE
ncbi:MAG: hypothetical protein OXH92_00015 [Bryobacterales bacterium]|nr:hypothetical protein [Bryobacterales bacterium]